ncbi:MAG: glutathione S-transferase [Betaproteobacteria bacterium]|nr:glutathione S-transferase [Betaproteobacteria bacterium]
MKLFGSTASPFTRKVRVVLAEKKIEYEFELDNPWGAESKVLSLNPLNQVPVLVLDDGSTLFDSRVIVEFLDNVSPISQLIPSTNREKIEVKRWEALADGLLNAGVLVRMENQRKDNERSPAWIARQQRKIHDSLAEMQRELAEKSWCTGNSYTLADIAVGCALGWLSFRFPEIDWRTGHPNLARELDKLSERASFADTLPHA